MSLHRPIRIIAAAALAATAPHATAQDQNRPDNAENLSLRLEVERAIDRGVAYLRSKQAADGSWGDTTQPALTALPLAALMADPSLDLAPGAPVPREVEAGYAFLLGAQKPDGGIYGKGLGVYNTSLALTALTLHPDRAATEHAVAEARRFIINQQSDFDSRGEADNSLDGGIGYGGTYSHSDLSNTHFALEALYCSKKMLEAPDGAPEEKFDLNWDAAIAFVSRCQNLKSHNDQPWASDDPDNKGGFIYFPGDSKAGEQELGDGRVALRSYGSMSYAGLLSLIYADVDRGDPRIQAVVDWLRSNYTLDENPGLDGQGLFYYYHSMAKALRLLGEEELELADGTEVDWRYELAKKLFDLQRPDGSWVNATGRWWENEPELVTSYAVLTLGHLHRAL